MDDGDLRLVHPRAVGRDSDSILWGDQNWSDDWSLTRFGRRQIDALSLSDAQGAVHRDFLGDSDRDFDPTLDVDRRATDLMAIPDSDIPRDPGLLVGDSVLDHAFGARDDSWLRGDIYLQSVASQNIYLREIAAWRESSLRSFV
jgi:hypothetical protein